MNILVLNGSPKGKTSATLHTALYLEALHTEHTFEYLPVAVRIKSYEKDFAPPAPRWNGPTWCFSAIRSTPSWRPVSCTALWS